MGGISTTIHAFHTIFDPSPDKSDLHLLDLGLIIARPFGRWVISSTKEEAMVALVIFEEDFVLARKEDCSLQ